MTVPRLSDRAPNLNVPAFAGRFGESAVALAKAETRTEKEEVRSI